MGGITTIINKVKYIGIASLTIAILSVLILNIISSYSSSSTNSNAEPVTQANSTVVSGAAEISLSISSYPSSSSTGGNNPNLSLSIPQGGGIATGRHTVSLGVGSDIGRYQVMLSSQTEETSLIDKDDSSNKATIPPINDDILDNYYGIYGIDGLERILSDTLQDSAWAYSVGPWSYDNSASTITGYIHNIPPSSKPDVIYGGQGIDKTGMQDVDVYYGAKVANLSTTPAGNYAAEIAYSVTAELQEPILTSVTPNTYELGSGADNTITITGKYLSTASKVYLMSTSTGEVNYCTDLRLVSNDAKGNTVLTCKIPTDQTDPAVVEPDSEFTLNVETDGGYASLDGFTYVKPSLCRSGDSDSTCRVDLDDNMIPISYVQTDDDGTPRWEMLSDDDISSNPGIWYDYDQKKWANAITLRDDDSGGVICVTSVATVYNSREQCNGTSYTPLEYAKAAITATGGAISRLTDAVVLFDQISREKGLGGIIPGYWVYIPRYSYQVMRKEVTNQEVTDTDAISRGGFNIHFETAEDVVKTPTTICDNSSLDYQECIKQTKGDKYLDYPGNNQSMKDQTAWATHPAFTWGDEELNGFWIGKFETTGTESSPTVLPNQYHQYPSSIGDMYDAAKSMGVEDPNNKYGNTESTNQSNQNNNNLAISTSHMLKNSEWGAVTYLASSKYGAGINNVQLNNSYGSGGTGKGPSGGAYNTVDGQKASTTNNIYGVYDMAGGAWEYVMGGYATDASQSMTNYLSIAVKPPYVDLYVDPPFSGTYRTNNNLCTWATCGGHALYETKNVQPVSSYDQSWGGDYSGFVDSSSPWFRRGGYASSGSYAGLFSSDNINGYTSYNDGFRVALLVN